MSVNLIATNRNVDASTRDHTNWLAITAIAPDHGMVFIDENTVDSIARLLDGQKLSNGEAVCAYAYDDDCSPPYVSSFGPCLLPTQVQDQIRDRLALSENGKTAVRLFNEIIRLGLQITLNGKEHCPAYIKGVNWVADEVEINRCQGNMLAMLRDLGIDARYEGPCEVEFDTFSAAVQARAHLTDYSAARLAAFVASGRRQKATHVYWA
ncbi:hypothetical protein [Sphingosinicella sp. BN140058]|uniref:hypothetical protein n=1 Tax=Sphingosinicella sp. BN140058 TaxID=1892855 RepID=UPI001011C0F9|nr:hypothetical protein [Sphingosinicella sp. BN140058]QAY80230.1 hypothetical protein ETR14_26670 [Sphingosinicella sp. BN140058]